MIWNERNRKGHCLFTLHIHSSKSGHRAAKHSHPRCSWEEQDRVRASSEALFSQSGKAFDHKQAATPDSCQSSVCSCMPAASTGGLPWRQAWERAYHHSKVLSEPSLADAGQTVAEHPACYSNATVSHKDPNQKSHIQLLFLKPPFLPS